MSFADDLKRFTMNTEQSLEGIFTGVAAEVQRSVVEGSELTGSPGQPVDTGNLRASWNLSFPDEHTAEISTNLEYAPAIEDGVGEHGPMTLRSAVGGFRSVAQTVNNFDKIVESERRKVVK